MSKKSRKILVLDIETAPLLSYCWGLFDQNIALNQIHKDWHLLSFACKWLDDPPSKIIYADQRNAKNIENDKPLLEKLWVLLNDAEIVIGQNIKSFDRKKINARFLHHGMKPPSSYKLIDTLTIAKKNFALTSNKLEYLSKFNTKYKKLKHNKFPGFSLWSECLKGNKEAFKEMEKYNKYDILSTQEIYEKLIVWDSSINFSLWSDSEEHVCTCGSKHFESRGFTYTGTGKYQRYVCKSCGKWSRGAQNLLTKEKKASLHRGA